MKILVTGGAGFMGSCFIRRMLHEHSDIAVTNLDLLTYAGNLENLKSVEQSPRYRFVQGDIGDSALINNLTQGMDAIVNYAAETHVDRSIHDPAAFARTDVMGMLTLLQAVRQNKVPKFVQISTDEVYGSLDEGEFTEDSPFLPNSPYAASKAGGDLMCRAYYETYQTPVIVTHSCNNYGPYHFPEKMIPLFITHLLEGKQIPVYGSGANVREWLYVEDHARAIDLILHQGKVGEVYNIGSGCRMTNLQLTQQLLELLELGEDRIDYVKDRLGHDRRYAVNFDKLKRELGFTPEWSLADGLRATVSWYRANPFWWQKLKQASDPFVNK